VIKLKINDIEKIYKKEENKTFTDTVFQFCYKNEIALPCFCFHEKLSIAGIVECV